MSKPYFELTTLLQGDLLEPEFYGDLVYRLRKIVDSGRLLPKLIFSVQLKNIVIHYKKTGFDMNILWQTACMAVNQIMIDDFGSRFNCTMVGCSSD